MKTTVEIITWVIVSLLVVALLTGVAVAYVVWFSLTWPWYLYRAGRRVAFPR